MYRKSHNSRKNGPPITGDCDICGKRTYLPFQCKRCLGIFCDEHHLPENHSCVPISKIIKEIKHYEEINLPKTEEEKIKNRIDEIKRIIVTLQTMYESREMGRSEYLDKITSFNREKDELESKFNQLQNNRTNIEKEKTSVDEQDNGFDNSGHNGNSTYSYNVDEKYKREFVGDISKANNSPIGNNIEKERKGNPKNRCDQCGLQITGMPFKCSRCGLSFCKAHRLPEYHLCTIRKGYFTDNFIEKTNLVLSSKFNGIKKWLNRRNYRRYHNWNTFFMNSIWAVILLISFLVIYSNIEKLNEMRLWLIPMGSLFLFINVILLAKYIYEFFKHLNYWFKGERNWVRYLTVFIIVSLIWQAYQQKETVLNPIIELNKEDFSSKFGISWDNFNTSKIFYIEPEQKNESKEAFTYLNQLRKQNNRRIIEWDDKIYELAVARSKDMYEKNYFDHTTPEGKCVKDFQSAYGLNKYTIAENLGAQYEGYNDRDMSFSKNIDVKGQVDGWMDSRGHRYNLMYPDHLKGAIGCYYGVCAFLGANTDTYGLGAGPCTTGDEGLAYWNSVGKQPGEI